LPHGEWILILKKWGCFGETSTRALHEKNIELAISEKSKKWAEQMG
jgi:hypothetical protein